MHITLGPDVSRENIRYKVTSAGASLVDLRNIYEAYTSDLSEQASD